MRRKLIAGEHGRCNKTATEAVALVEEIKKAPRAHRATPLVARPTPRSSRSSPRPRAARSRWRQNMHFEKEGAFTGEVSAGC